MVTFKETILNSRLFFFFRFSESSEAFADCDSFRTSMPYRSSVSSSICLMNSVFRFEFASLVNRINSKSCFNQFRLRESVVDLGVRSFGFELLILRRSTVFLECAGVERRAPQKLCRFGTPRTNGDTCGIHHLKRSDSSAGIPEPGEIFLVEIKIRMQLKFQSLHHTQRYTISWMNFFGCFMSQDFPLRFECLQ